MRETNIKVLIGDNSRQARCAAGELGRRGIKAMCVAREPLAIQRECLRSSYCAAVIRRDTPFCAELCQSLKLDGIAAVIVVHDGMVSDLTPSADGEIACLDDHEQLCRRLTALTPARSSEGQTGTADSSLRSSVTNMLSRLSLSPKYTGYSYVREAIMLAMTDSCTGISKSIYPAIALKNNTSAAAVERGIRTAIQKGWARADDGSKLEIFGTYAVNSSWKPTNSEFIFMIADKLLSSHTYHTVVEYANS